MDEKICVREDRKGFWFEFKNGLILSFFTGDGSYSTREFDGNGNLNVLSVECAIIRKVDRLFVTHYFLDVMYDDVYGHLDIETIPNLMVSVQSMSSNMVKRLTEHKEVSFLNDDEKEDNCGNCESKNNCDNYNCSYWFENFG